MIIYQLLVLLAAASLGRAEYKWTGTEWVYVEPDREEKDRNYESSGGGGVSDDEDYNYDYGDSDYNTGGGQSNTNFHDIGDGGGYIDNQHGGLDSSKFNFERPGISDDEDFGEGSGAGGSVFSAGGGSPALPIDSEDNYVEGSGDYDYSDGGPYIDPTKSTTSSRYPKIDVEEPNFTPTKDDRPTWEQINPSKDPVWDTTPTKVDEKTPSFGGWPPAGPSTEDDEEYEDYTYSDNNDDYYNPSNNGGGISLTPDHDYPTYDDNIIIDDTKPVPKIPSVTSTEAPFYPAVVGSTPTTRQPYIPAKEPPIVTDIPNRTVSFFAQPGILAAVIGGAVVGLLCAILLVMFIVYRMRKKDEGSYILDEPKRMHNGNVYTKTPNREFYA